MNKRILNEKEQAELQKNNNVQYCSDRSITFTTAFKEKAIRQYESGLTAREIFKQSGLDINLIGKETPAECIRRWKKIVKHKGMRGLLESRGGNRYGKPKKHTRSRDEQMKYLEAEVKYLRAENSFLAQLRAKKTE